MRIRQASPHTDLWPLTTVQSLPWVQVKICVECKDFLKTKVFEFWVMFSFNTVRKNYKNGVMLYFLFCCCFLCDGHLSPWGSHSLPLMMEFRQKQTEHENEACLHVKMGVSSASLVFEYEYGAHPYGEKRTSGLQGERRVDQTQRGQKKPGMTTNWTEACTCLRSSSPTCSHSASRLWFNYKIIIVLLSHIESVLSQRLDTTCACFIHQVFTTASVSHKKNKDHHDCLQSAAVLKRIAM